MQNLKKRIVELAKVYGFDLVRVTSSDDFVGDQKAALARIEAGLMEGLHWFTESRVIRGTRPQELLPGARSIICLGISYLHQEDASGESLDRLVSAGKVARYAWVKDYHRVMKRRMRDFVRGLEASLESSIAARWHVDDGPMLDRATAARSGLGWFGKNTNILTPSHGSWVFLGQVITDLDLDADAPLKKSCGSCVRCIDKCPTGAIVAPYVLDNTRCISYLTIENRGAIPINLRPLMQNWVFGCDICQDVCPVNRKAEAPEIPVPLPINEGPAAIHGLLQLVELLEMTESEFKSRFQGTSVMRAKHVGMQRNACVALGNLGDVKAIPSLCRALWHSTSLVRGHAAWALGQIGTPEALEALAKAESREPDAGVLEEIGAALAEATALARI